MLLLDESSVWRLKLPGRAIEARKLKEGDKMWLNVVKDLDYEQIQKIEWASQKMAEKVKRFSNNEEMQKIIAIATDDKVLESVEELSKFSNWENFFIAQGAFWLSFIVIRSLLVSKLKMLSIKWLLYKLVSVAFFWMVSLYFIPMFVLGESYTDFFSAIAKGIKEQYF